MNKEYEVKNQHKVCILNTKGENSYRDNTENIDKILQTENDIESISNQIKCIEEYIRENENNINVSSSLSKIIIYMYFLISLAFTLGIGITLSLKAITVITAIMIPCKIVNIINTRKEKRKRKGYLNQLNYLNSIKFKLEKELNKLKENKKIKEFESAKLARFKTFERISKDLERQIIDDLKVKFDEEYHKPLTKKDNKVLSFRKVA